MHQARKSIMVMMASIIVLWAPLSASAYSASLDDASSRRELRAFFGGLMPAQMDAFHLPGAVVSVVEDGRLVFARGYGVANVKEYEPVVAGKTLFRLASISKLFVWTAVMQLVEEGKLNLEADVNVYLQDFKIPDTYPEPITLLHLMNHTAGFEERSLGTSARRPADLQPLGIYLAQNMPARVRQPGQLTAYSNYGAALAGYIVEEVSGLPFEQYIEDHIFDPLEMYQSTFRQPLPTAQAPHLASGHTYAAGVYEPQDIEWAQLAPAAGLSAPATDMANFMIAHLQEGRFGNTRILEESTVTRMQQQSFTNDSRVSGYAFGFSEATINGRRLLGHNGDMLTFHSALYLQPEQNRGFFVAFNGANGLAAVLGALQAVMDYYGGERQPVTESPPAIEDNVPRYAGVYWPTRGEYTTAGKMVRLLRSISVRPSGAHRLLVSVGFPAQIAGQYAQVAPGIFRAWGGLPSAFGDVIFQSDDEGQVRALFQQNNPGTAYVKAPWYATPQFNLALLGMVVLSFLSVLVWAPVGWWIRRSYKETGGASLRLAAWWQVLLSATAMLFLVGFAAVFSNPEVVFGLSTWAQAVFLLPLPIAMLAIGMIAFTVVAWRSRRGSLLGRIHYTVVTLSGLAFVWWLAYWNLWIGCLR